MYEKQNVIERDIPTSEMLSLQPHKSHGKQFSHAKAKTPVFLRFIRTVSIAMWSKLIQSPTLRRASWPVWRRHVKPNNHHNQFLFTKYMDVYAYPHVGSLPNQLLLS